MCKHILIRYSVRMLLLEALVSFLNFQRDESMHIIKLLALVSAIGCVATAHAANNVDSIRKEGERDGKRYAEDGRRNGIKVDGTFCAVGVSAEDAARPELSQAEIEAYAQAYAGACMGRKVH